MVNKDTNYSSSNRSNRDTDNAKMDAKSEQRVHEAYAAMGHKGGLKGGEARKAQMAKEGFIDHESSSNNKNDKYSAKNRKNNDNEDSRR